MGLFTKKNENVENNPFAEGVVKATEKELNLRESPVEPMETLFYQNDGISISAAACVICWDVPLPKSYMDKVVYLGKRVRTGHNSVIEHSKHAIYMELPMDYLFDLTEVACASHYLKFTNPKISKINPNKMYVIAYGTWRGYMETYNNLDDPNSNMVMKMITKNIYRHVPSTIFKKLIADDIMGEENFANNLTPDFNEAFKANFKPNIVDDGKKIEIENCTDIYRLQEMLVDICPEPELFTLYDLMGIATITVLFKDMSRTATHQLVRHRNAITQESQRYVDYSEAQFIDPLALKPNRYDVDHIYHINFGGEEFEFTSAQLGEAIQAIYPQIVRKSDSDDTEQKMMKEDARSFLPGNVACKKIYMTFDFKMFFKFLELRTDPHAQAEIRSFAVILDEWFKTIFPDIDMAAYLLPRYKAENVELQVEIPTDDKPTIEDYVREIPELQETEQE